MLARNENSDKIPPLGGRFSSNSDFYGEGISSLKKCKWNIIISICGSLVFLTEKTFETLEDSDYVVNYCISEDDTHYKTVIKFYFSNSLYICVSSLISENFLRIR